MTLKAPNGEQMTPVAAIPPIWFAQEDATGFFTPDSYVDQPTDTRTEEDYLEIKFDEPVRCPKHTAKKKTR